MLAGTDRPKFPLSIRGIKVNRKFSRLYFLHTAAWGGAADAGRYRINYADGRSVDLPLVGNRNIGDWWNASPLPEALVGIYRKNPAGNNIGTYIAEWENPRPGTEIASIDFLSPLFRERNDIDYLPSKTAVPALIAVTGETAHPAPVDMTGRNFVNCNPAKEVGSTVSGTVRKVRDGWNIAFRLRRRARSLPPSSSIRRRECPAGTITWCSALGAAVTGMWKSSCRRKIGRDATPASLRCPATGSSTPTASGSARSSGGPEPSPLSDLRNELFFFYRGNRERPALDFTVGSATLE